MKPRAVAPARPKYSVTAELPAELFTKQHLHTKRAARIVARQLREAYPVVRCEVRIATAGGDRLETWAHDGRAWRKAGAR